MNDQGKTYRVLGLMSGTSLDGLDICYVEFCKKNKSWSFNIGPAQTIPYKPEWQENLRNAPQQSGLELAKLHTTFGRFCAQAVRTFQEEHHLEIDLISSHGHTVFHRPDLGYTLQIGCGATLAAQTGITTACDFRTADVALGGQGAPLVPIGDRHLFGAYDYCLNIGGFSNISFEQNARRIAGDLCPANIVLNALAMKEGYAMDVNGELAGSGTLIDELYRRLNELPYYQAPHPKSLGREWVSETIDPLLSDFESCSTRDLLRTFTEHIAWQINRALPENPDIKLLISGGGALNLFLIQRIKSLSKVQVFVAENKILHYKEALIFGFLGVLRFINEANCLSSVTGASSDHCSGSLHLGRNHPK